jgi:CRP/FNR family transcriptional regulator, cyclic AMP receptor protein
LNDAAVVSHDGENYSGDIIHRVASREETASLLRRVSIFSDLTEEQLLDLAAVAVPRRWSAGETIFREGDPGDTCYVLQEGCVRVTRNHSDGRTITLAELRPGDLFGELAMFDSERRSATVEAAEESTAVALLAGDMRRLLLRHPDISLKLLSAFADRLKEANERISRQSFQTVASRVAGVLLAQAETLEAQGAGSENVLIRSTRAELAQLAGSSRESVSRFLATLERAGLVTSGRGKVVIHDPSALRRYIY